MDARRRRHQQALASFCAALGCLGPLLVPADSTSGAPEEPGGYELAGEISGTLRTWRIQQRYGPGTSGGRTSLPTPGCRPPAPAGHTVAGAAVVITSQDQVPDEGMVHAYQGPASRRPPSRPPFSSETVGFPMRTRATPVTMIASEHLALFPLPAPALRNPPSDTDVSGFRRNEAVLRSGVGSVAHTPRS